MPSESERIKTSLVTSPVQSHFLWDMSRKAVSVAPGGLTEVDDVDVVVVVVEVEVEVVVVEVEVEIVVVEAEVEVVVGV